MQPSNWTSLWEALSGRDNVPNAFLWGLNAGVAFRDLLHGSALGGRGEELRGRSVVIATKDQFTAALALIELDGVARRLVLCPADLPSEQSSFVMDAARADAIVSDHPMEKQGLGTAGCFVPCKPTISPGGCNRSERTKTEWILLTSGTTGRPKLVVHTLASLAGAIKYQIPAGRPRVWSTFYDIRRYGGLQIFLRAVLTSASLVLSNAEEDTADFLARAAACAVTHISGTPSHWRRALMSPSVHLIAPQYVRLSGEIADQSILTRLQSVFADAKVEHAFASTEAGLAFEVSDGLSGFPAALIGRNRDVETKVEDGSLRIRSCRTATCYLGRDGNALRGPDGFVDTGDMLELEGDRYYFVGRRDGTINVGGLKVHPEEVEAVINKHPRVQMSRVRARKNPITGSVVVADVVLGKKADAGAQSENDLQREILHFCGGALPRHKVPAAVNIVSALPVDAAGKLARNHA
jgi:acyl-coenzyme A synthetase/AMP-(fatty) acid ligase